jgi:hypothetical protein
LLRFSPCTLLTRGRGGRNALRAQGLATRAAAPLRNVSTGIAALAVALTTAQAATLSIPSGRNDLPAVWAAAAVRLRSVRCREDTS